MLQFKVEWEDAPRVRDPLLRATWARLEIRAPSGGREFALTECIDRTSQSVRQGVYGSVYPLAAWITQNWWSLLHEAAREESYFGARLAAEQEYRRPWLRRHALLTARAGFALPDCIIHRDGGRVAVRCVADQTTTDSDYPVRFINQADVRLLPADVERSLQQFVEAVVQRLLEHAPTAAEARELIGNWEAVRESAREEHDTCAAAAAMGLDPYDSTELTDELVSLLEGRFRSLPRGLKEDLAESSTKTTLEAGMNWVLGATHEVTKATNGSNGYDLHIEDLPAHEAGYQQARSFLKKFSAPARDGLEQFLVEQCGWSDAFATNNNADGLDKRISGLVGPDSAGRPLLTLTRHSHPTKKRFLLARALFFAPSADAHSPPRLLTQASSWWQRASRAFAAELLAPAAELRQHFDEQVTNDQITAIASEFQVSEMVIRHQIGNHHLARIVDY